MSKNAAGQAAAAFVLPAFLELEELSDLVSDFVLSDFVLSLALVSLFLSSALVPLSSALASLPELSPVPPLRA